jgi:RNA-binding protein
LRLVETSWLTGETGPAIFHVRPPGFPHTPSMLALDNAKIRDLKARGQLLKPTLKVGKEGLTPQFLAALDEALKHHELLKVKFDHHKESKKELAPQLAEKSGSQLIMRVGNVVVLYRPKPAAE